MYEHVTNSQEHKNRVMDNIANKGGDLRRRLALVDNRPEVVSQRRPNAMGTNQNLGSVGQLKSQGSSSHYVIQRLSHEYYDKAELRYSSRAFAHMSQEVLEKYLWENQSSIIVGNQRTILIGGGLRTGYAVNGNISYDCWFDENAGRHVIKVYHAHDRGKMG